MTNRNIFLALATLGLSFGSAYADNSAPGIVNATTCMEQSKFAQNKKTEIDSYAKELQAKLESLHKEYKEIEDKLKNTEYVDSITPEAEKNLENEKAARAQKLGMAQSEFSQMMQQKQMEYFQALQESISEAAQLVAAENHLSGVASKDIYFYFDPALEITDKVIAKMDELYDQKQKTLEEKKVASAKKTSLETSSAAEETSAE